MMMKQNADFVSDEIAKLVPVLGKDTAARLARAYLIGDETSRRRIVEMLDMVKASVLADTDLNDAALMEPPAQCDGELTLGSKLYGRKAIGPFAISLPSLLTHVGIFGSSGYGKTNLSLLLVEKLAERDIPVIVFDFSKRNYRDLLPVLGGRLSVYTVGRSVAPFQFNPLGVPPGTDRTQWMKEFATVFDHAYWLLGGGQHIILKALTHAYDAKPRPRLSDLSASLDALATGTSREKNWLSTALRPLESLGMDGVRQVFDCETGVTAASLLAPGRVTVLELDALSPNDRTFFIEIVLQWLRDYLLVHGQREQLSGVVILEEAHHILNREKLKKLGTETVMDTVFREIRELGVGIVYADQHPSLVSYPALGNTSTQFYFNLGLDSKYVSDIQDAANMLGLDDELKSHLRRLPVGHACALMRASAFSRPFLVAFDHVPIVKGSVTDAMVAAHMQAQAGYAEQDETNDMPQIALQSAAPLGTLDEAASRVLRAIGQGRGVTASELYKAVRMSGSAFNQRIASLERMGLVAQRGVKKGRATARFTYLTPPGEAAFTARASYSGTVTIDNPLRLFELAGWQATPRTDHIELTRHGETVRLIMLTERDRAAIDAAVRDGFHYLCASPDIKNVLLQQAARKGGLMIFVTTTEDFIMHGDFDALRL